MTTVLLLLLAAVVIWAFAESRTAGAAVAAVVGVIAALGLGYYVWRDVSGSRTATTPPAARERAPAPEQFKRSLTALQTLRHRASEPEAREQCRDVFGHRRRTEAAARPRFLGAQRRGEKPGIGTIGQGREPQGPALFVPVLFHRLPRRGEGGGACIRLHPHRRNQRRPVRSRGSAGCDRAVHANGDVQEPGQSRQLAVLGGRHPRRRPDQRLRP